MTSDFNIDRRKLIKLGFSASFLATLPAARMAFADDLAESLLEFVSDSETPVDSSRVGTLREDEFASLFSLCEYVDKTWQFGADMTQYGQQLRADLELKTTRRPSYLAEYHSALTLIDRITGNVVKKEETWPVLLFSETAVEHFSASRLGRARRFVFAELIGHQVPISGAFRSFGLINYRGYFGGPYALPESYRRAVF